MKKMMKTKKSKKKYKVITVRLDENLYRELADYTISEGFSMNGFIVSLIQESLAISEARKA